MNQSNDNPQDISASRQADERMVHALLLHLHDDHAAENRQRRVAAAMNAVREPVASYGSGRTIKLHIWIRRGAWVAAAMVLLVVGIGLFTYNPTPAMASLNDILGALGRPGDRTYQIRMEDIAAPPEPNPPDSRPPEQAPRPNLDNSKLYLRNGSQYLLVRNDPKGGLMFDGFDGQQSWRVRANMLAEARDGLGAGGIPMPPMMADVPFSDLHRTLEQIRTDYTVEQFNNACMPADSRIMRHVIVRRNSRQIKGPETIEIWADPKTAIPKRIIFDDAKLPGNPGPCRLTFDLVSEQPLPDDWFTPASHIDAGKPGRG